MIVPGPCSECGAPLDSEQRYCINCGNRVAPPLALPYVPATAAAGTAGVAAGAAAGTAAAAGAGTASWLPMPIQALTTFAALALGFGVVVGTALSPNLSNLIAAPQQVAQAPVAPAPAPAPAPKTGGGGGAPAPVASTDPVVPTGTIDDDGGGGGGGGGSEKPEKEKKPTYLNGTVVHTNPVAQSYTISSSGGLSAIHANGLPPIGKIVRVPVRSLENRTFAEDGKRQLKADAAQATFAGIVTDNRDSVDPLVPDTYTVSARGASVLIHSPLDASVGTVEVPPAIGKLVTTTVEIRNLVPTPQPVDPSPGPVPPTCEAPPQGLPSPPVTFTKELHQTAIVVDPATVGVTQIETVIQKLCQATGEFLVSSDDVREGLTDVTLTSSGIDMSFLNPSQPVIGSVTIVDDPLGPPGTKKLGSLTGVANDQGAEGADDPAGGQGALARVARVSERRIVRAFERAQKKRKQKRMQWARSSG